MWLLFIFVVHFQIGWTAVAGRLVGECLPVKRVPPAYRPRGWGRLGRIPENVISLIYFRQKLFLTRWRTAIIPFKVLMTFVLSFCKLSSVFRSSCWQAASLKEERREPSSRKVEGPGVNLRIQLIKGVKGWNETYFFRNYLLNSRTAQTPST